MFSTQNQNIQLKSLGSSRTTMTLAQLKTSREIKNPAYENGTYPVIQNTIYAVNATGKNAELYLYKGNVQWGEVMTVTPFHHFQVQSHLGIDCIEIANKFSMNVTLEFPRLSNTRDKKVLIDPCSFDLEGYGTYILEVSDRNIVNVVKSNEVPSQQPNTFYINFKSNDTNFQWKIELFLDDAPCKTITSSINSNKNENKWVCLDQNLANNFPTQYVEIQVEPEFTLFLLKGSNFPNNMKEMSNKTKSFWGDYATRQLIVPGKMWVGTLENDQDNTCFSTIVDANEILYSDPQPEKVPVSRGYGQT